MFKTKIGTTLVEVIVAVLITTIMIIIVMSAYTYAQTLLIDRGNERLAMNLARSELEKTLAFAYTGIIPGTESYDRTIGELSLVVTKDIAEYRYDYGSAMAKVVGSTSLPDSIGNVPFDTNWSHPTVSEGLRYKLIRLTAVWNDKSVHFQQIIAEGWRD